MRDICITGVVVGVVVVVMVVVVVGVVVMVVVMVVVVVVVVVGGGLIDKNVWQNVNKYDDAQNAPLINYLIPHDWGIFYLQMLTKPTSRLGHG